MKCSVEGNAMKIILPLIVTLIVAAQSPALDISLPVHYDSLENGMRIIIVPDANVAVVSCRLYYFVGSMYEGPGTSGLSHMYEHMMFKGTKTLGTHDYEKELPYMFKIDSIDAHIVKLKEAGYQESDSMIQALRKDIFAVLEQQRKLLKKDEIWELYMNNGGTHLNAWTGDDMTAYIVTLPKNKVELFYWIEADRMRNPVLREFYSERDVVTEERHMRYENQPRNRYFERLFGLYYLAHPYRLPTIGWMSDIRNYTREKMYAHINKYYTPDNALLVLVGAVDPVRAKKDIARYFGSIPPADEPKREVVTREPAAIGERRFIVHDEAEPRIDLLFHTPGYPHDDLYRLDVLEGILSGRSGRLYKRLVTEEQLCTNAGAGNAFRLHDGYFHVWATLKEGTDPHRVEKIIAEELQLLSAEPPHADEMERNKNSIRMSFTTGLQSLEGISDRLAWFERLGAWQDLLTYPEKIAEVNPNEIPAIAKKYFNPRIKTIGMLLKKDAQREETP
ncbi:MAG: insulinase family protein [Chitinivibrionales bacterium]|nr:insulinase family protein [Chitinivibrionales bacterium]